VMCGVQVFVCMFMCVLVCLCMCVCMLNDQARDLPIKVANICMLCNSWGLLTFAQSSVASLMPGASQQGLHICLYHAHIARPTTTVGLRLTLHTNVDLDRFAARKYAIHTVGTCSWLTLLYSCVDWVTRTWACVRSC